jgi:hypothetical protein
MRTNELKNEIENTAYCSGTDIIAYLKEYHTFLSDKGFSACCLATLFFCASSTSFKIVNVGNTKFLFKEEGNKKYQLQGLPVADTLDRIREAVSCCLELGIGLDLSDLDLLKLKMSPIPEVIIDSYLYEHSSMFEYLEGCSRSTRKNINRFDREYSFAVFKANCVSDRVMNAIKDINEIWLKEFKDGNKDYEYNIDNTELCLTSHLISLINAAVIVYYDKEDKIVAYDYFEAWGDTVYSLGGKSIIKDLSSFKSVNRNVMKVANDLFGATKMDIGYSTIYKPLSMKPITENSLKLTEAKSSFPNTRTLYNIFYTKPSKYSKVEAVDNSSNSLF